MVYFLKSYPIRFQRQKTLGNYIVDFYCAKANLVIELDGGGHFEPEQIAKDNERSAYLKSTGLQVLRILNSDIDKIFTETCNNIHNCIVSVLGSP